MQSNDRVVHYWNAAPAPDVKYRGQGRSRTKSLTKRQRMFVEDCLTTSQTFEQVKEKHHITDNRLAGWFAEQRFADYIERISQCLAKQREMIVAIAAVRGASFLQQTAHFGAADPRDDAKRTSRCRAALALIRLGREREVQRRSMRSRRPAPRERSIAHPDNSPEENLRLLEALEGRQASD